MEGRVTGTTYPANDPTLERIPRVKLAAALVQGALVADLFLFFERMRGGWAGRGQFVVIPSRRHPTCKGLVLMIYVHIVISTKHQIAQECVSETLSFQIIAVT